ncbi:hypothetical protein EVJ58_g3143 [Rhodofomes roseus]|uniref:Uncharacterized protein n=1 Tax=Rhodofomes roseus TaxID=34475 RepID=A0A4Y9YPC5_9APHY|nr:hypothetical protein EVJ58_g3143 [Rhodofomes roseus]
MAHKARRAGKRERKKTFTVLIAKIATDHHALSLLARSGDPRPRLEFEAILYALLDSTGRPSPAGDLFSGFIQWCDSATQLPDVLSQALVDRKRSVEIQYRIRMEFVASMGLKRMKEAAKAQWLSENAHVVVLDRLREAYPEYHQWIAETPEIEQQWGHRIRKGKKADKRHKRHPLVLEDPSRLRYVVKEDESVVFRDKETGDIIMMVIRDFCKDPRALKFVDCNAAESVDLRKSVRLEDPGKLVLLGYTAGSRSHPLFDWARNLRSKKHTPEFLKDLDFRLSSAFALFWNLLQVRIPKEVLAPFESYLADNSMCRMDGNSGKSTDSRGIYMVDLGDKYIEFNDAELAPPSGVAGCNYARAIHREKQAQKWAFSWTTSRRKGMTGGSFYEAVYGIKVLQAPNTMVAWMPEHDHGTSLLDWSPNRKDDIPPFAQTGIALVTSTRLASAWEKYRNTQDFAQAEKEWVGTMEADVDEKCGREGCTFCYDDRPLCTDQECPICM